MDMTRFMSAHRRFLLGGLLVLIVVFIATLSLWAGAYNVRVLTSVLIYVVLAVSWAMFSGTTGYMSLAPAAFFGVGIYAMALLQKELPFFLIIAIGGAICFAFALLVGLVTLRLRGIYFAIFTFGLVVFMTEVVQYLETRLYAKHGQAIIPIDNDTLLYIALGLVVLAVLAAYFVRRSRYGLALLSIGGNEEAAEHMGVNTTMVKVLFFAISSIFMGAAGVIAAPTLIYVNSNIAFSPFYSFMPILMAIFGGMGHLFGPVVGALIFGYLERTLRSQLFTYFMLGFGIIMVLVILFLPNGIVGLVPMLQDRLWGPVPPLRNDRTWKPTAAGILSIIGGVVQVGGGIVFAMISRFLAQFAGLGIGGVIGLVAGFHTVVAIVLIILGLIAILGGICALRRSSWRLGLAGSICALFGPAIILGIPAIILIILGKDEFQYVVEGGRAEQYANT
jgi:branched-chain amino acid transport system permease protein